MRKLVTMCLIIISLICFVVFLNCDPPEPDSGACKNRLRLYALPSSILADGASSAVIQGWVKDEFGDPLEGAVVNLLTSAGSFDSCGDTPATATPAPTPTPTSSNNRDKKETHGKETFNNTFQQATPYPGSQSLNTSSIVCTTGGNGVFSAVLVASTIPDTTATVLVYVPQIDCENTVEVNFIRAEPYHIQLTANPSTISADDEKSYITALVTNTYGNAVADISVDFTTTLGTFDSTNAERTILTTDSHGMATAILESRGVPGTARVRAVVPPNQAIIYVTFLP